MYWVKNIKYILPIHDCFGVHPNDLAQVYEILKITFIQIYLEKDFLDSFHNNILYILKLNINLFYAL